MLVVAAAQAAAVTLLGLLLFHLHRRLGQAPLLSLLALLAFLVPMAAYSDGPALSPALVLVPAFLALALLAYCQMGWRTVHTVAALPAAAGLFVGGLVGVAALVPTVVPPGALPSRILDPVVVGVALWLAAAGAALLYQRAAALRLDAVVAIPIATATAVGSGLFAGLTYAAAGYIGAATSPSATIGGSVLVALVPGVIAGIVAAVHLSGLSPDLRRDLLRRQPEGLRSLADRYVTLEAQQAQDERASQEQASSYRDLLEVSPEGAYICRPNGRIVYANPALARLLDRPEEDLTGKNAAHLLGNHDGKGRLQLARYVVREGRHRAAVMLPNGHARMIEVTVRTSSNGTVHGRVRDLTEDYLRQEVEAQKERAELYVTLMRHDIGNHLTTPMLQLEMLAEGDDLPPSACRRARMALAAVNDISQLLHRVDLLDQADHARPAPVDAAPMVRSVVESFRRRYPDLTIGTDLPDDGVWLRATPLLQDALSNLVGNAHRHAGETATITVGAQRRGDTWVLRVDDDGPGVPDDQKKEVFSRSVCDQDNGGTGLGLYIVEAIVEALKGRAWVADRVEGSPEEGASFRLELQAAKPPAGRQTLPDTSGEGPTDAATGSDTARA